MQLAIPWPNPDDLRKEEAWSVSTSFLEMFPLIRFVAFAGGASCDFPAAFVFFGRKNWCIFHPGISTTETLRGETPSYSGDRD